MTLSEPRENARRILLPVRPSAVNGVAVAAPRGARGARELLYPLSPDARLFREQVKAALQDPLFATPPGLNAEAQARLSYERFRFLRRTLDIRAADVTDNPGRLMTV